jgi:hypothetical protein
MAAVSENCAMEFCVAIRKSLFPEPPISFAANANTRRKCDVLVNNIHDGKSWKLRHLLWTQHMQIAPPPLPPTKKLYRRGFISSRHVLHSDVCNRRASWCSTAVQRGLHKSRCMAPGCHHKRICMRAPVLSPITADVMYVLHSSNVFYFCMCMIISMLYSSHLRRVNRETEA